MRALIALISLFALAGCAGKPIGSIVGGECKLTGTPEYAVRGKTAYDQRWVNRTTEALVVGCKQPRPKKRPESFDAPTPVAAKPKVPVAPVPTSKKKRWWWDRA